MYTKETINEFAERLGNFFLFFDGLFLHDEDAGGLLEHTRQSLKEKISRNVSASIIITALGGDYDSDIDNAKVEELDALIKLLSARQKLRRATLRRHEEKGKNAEALASLFGIGDAE